MGSTILSTPFGSAGRARMWLGFALLFAGLMGHVFTARFIGGTRYAYVHHIAGFVGLTVVSGLILAGLGWRFWKGRPDITILALGVVQAALGLLVWVLRFSDHG